MEVDHAEHGRSDDDETPNEPDCPCRDTPNEPACAATGCGFCLAATGQLK